MKIAVGTMSDQKLGYLREVLDEMKVKARLLPFAADSGISEQPISMTETKEGSINRAKGALKNHDDADFAIGIEVGYHPDKNDKFEMLCCATIIDKNGDMFTDESHRVLLPEFYQEILKSNKYLSDHVDRFLEENLDEYSQQVGIDVKCRKPFIETSLKRVLGKYLAK